MRSAYFEETGDPASVVKLVVNVVVKYDQCYTTSLLSSTILFAQTRVPRSAAEHRSESFWSVPETNMTTD